MVFCTFILSALQHTVYHSPALGSKVAESTCIAEASARLALDWGLSAAVAVNSSAENGNKIKQNCPNHLINNSNYTKLDLHLDVPELTKIQTLDKGMQCIQRAKGYVAVAICTHCRPIILLIGMQ